MQSIIIGSGIAGLATAVRLAAAGHAVTVFEAQDYPGGKLSEFSLGGYRFDRGPSLFTMPQYVDELFMLAGENPRDHFRYRKIEETCRYYYEDGTVFTAHADRARFAAELKEKLGADTDAFFAHLDGSRKIYELIGPLFMEQSLHRAGNFVNRASLRALLHLPQYKLFRTLHEVNAQKIADPRLQQYFDRFATYNGSDPFRAPAMLHIIPHIEHGFGVFFPEKGMYDITQSIYRLALRLGVQFRFGEACEEILLNGKTVRGIRTASGEHAADLVVSNMDIYPTYRKLLPGTAAPEKILAQEKSSSAVIFYWGIRKKFPELLLHNIFFSGDYPAEFGSIFRSDRPHADPTVYINITSKEKPGDAPPGGENWFVMVNAPHQRGQDWNAIVAETRRQVLEKLERRLGEAVAPHIEAEEVWTPQGIGALTSSHLGALYGNASNTRMAAFLRHRNFSREIGNLYFCGGSVHPGGGIPLCLLSAKITAGLITQA